MRPSAFDGCLIPTTSQPRPPPSMKPGWILWGSVRQRGAGITCIKCIWRFFWRVYGGLGLLLFETLLIDQEELDKWGGRDCELSLSSHLLFFHNRRIFCWVCDFPENNYSSQPLLQPDVTRFWPVGNEKRWSVNSWIWGRELTLLLPLCPFYLLQRGSGGEPSRSKSRKVTPLVTR